MSEEFHDYAKLLTYVRERIGQHSPWIIGIEGYRQAGKSTIAKRLSTDLLAPLIGTDGFSYKQLNPDAPRDHLLGRPYVDWLDHDVLSKRLAEACNTNAVAIIEGMCLGDVLTKISRSATLTIYVKCIARDSEIWHPDYNLEKYESGSKEFKGLDRDELEYHHRRRPHEKADVVRVRFEE